MFRIFGIKEDQCLIVFLWGGGELWREVRASLLGSRGGGPAGQGGGGVSLVVVVGLDVGRGLLLVPVVEQLFLLYSSSSCVSVEN